ncbi:MAG: polysaccharide biosynthesis/export family protein [Paludibacter sp.]|nr:polysaccharide biosynthesis/export family protein [Paludibacter sp.]
MNYNVIFKVPFLVLTIFLLASCAGVKDIAYFQKLDNSTERSNPQKNSLGSDSNQASSLNLQKSTVLSSQSKFSENYDLEKNSEGLYEARIKPKDMLSITVVSSEPDASRMYNLIMPQIETASTQNILSTQPTLQTYEVDNDGNIEFPVFGKIKVAGLTRGELESILHKKLASAFTKETPIITIRFTNYSVNILGEVLRPGKYETTNDRLTIFEGLALAGDLTIYGQRNNVKVLRENYDGSKEYITLNLNDRNIIYSPAYYLEQNDVVYVEPNKSKSKSSNYGAAESFGISSLSVLLTLTSIALTVFKVKF